LMRGITAEHGAAMQRDTSSARELATPRACL
jgi:hypothetical protein